MRTEQLKNIYFESHLLQSEAEKDFKLVELLKTRQGNAIVHCATAQAVDCVHDFLSAHGIETLSHHKRMRGAERKNALAIFNAAKSAVLVTCGEPEGLEAVVRLVIHFNYPVSMTQYIDQCAIAGRDGMPARCSLLYLRTDKRAQKRDPEELRKVVMYSQSALCRVGLLAKHVGEEAGLCHRCDSCLKTSKSRPVEEKKRVDLDAILEASL